MVDIEQVKQTPEYRDMELLGFKDVTKPIRRKKGGLAIAHPGYSSENYPDTYVLLQNGTVRDHSGSKPNPVPGISMDTSYTIDDWRMKLNQLRKYHIKRVFKNKYGMTGLKQLNALVDYPNLLTNLVHMQKDYPELFKKFMTVEVKGKAKEIDLGDMEGELIKNIEQNPTLYATMLGKIYPAEELKRLATKLSPAVRAQFSKDSEMISDLTSIGY